MASQPKLFTVTITEKELALLSLTRRIGNGLITELVVKKGEPVLIKSFGQRLDLERADELDAALGVAQEGKYDPVLLPIPGNLPPLWKDPKKAGE